MKDRVLGGAALAGALVVLAAPAQAAAPPGPWDAFNLAPASRTVRPVGVLKTGGDVTNAAGLTNGGVTSLGPNGYVTLDFGKEVGGFARLHFAPGSAAPTAGADLLRVVDLRDARQQRPLQRREQQRAAGDLPRARGRRDRHGHDAARFAARPCRR